MLTGPKAKVWGALQLLNARVTDPNPQGNPPIEPRMDMGKKQKCLPFFKKLCMCQLPPKTQREVNK